MPTVTILSLVNRVRFCGIVSRGTLCPWQRQIAVLMLFASLLVVAPGVARSGTLPSFDRVRILTAPREIQDAELTDQNDMPFLLSSLRGRVVLVLFGFTHCTEVCSLGMARMLLLQESHRVDPEKIAYVLISVDGDRDTPVVMREFLRKFSPDFVGLTGDPASVKPIAANFSASFFKGNVGEHGDHYTVSHSPQIFMLDPAGQIRAEMYSASVDAMSGLALALLEEAQETSH